MPLYEYQCEACGHRFEVILKFSDPPIETCPKCGGRVRKLQSAPSFQFKGSGFYITDYPKKDQSPAGRSDSSEKKDGASDGSGGEKKDSSKAESSGEKSASTDSAAPSTSASKDSKST